MLVSHRPKILASLCATLACATLAHAETPITSDTPGEPAASSTQPAPPEIVPSNLTKLTKPIPSPHHPRHRMVPGLTVAAGVYCPNFGTRSVPFGQFCAPRVHVALDGPYADIHVDLLHSYVLGWAGMLGFEIGTRYMQLGSRRSKAALAVRGSFDMFIAQVSKHVPGYFDDGLLSFSNTYGPQFSVALNPRTSLEIRGAVGWTVGSYFSNHEGFNRPLYGIVADGWIGVRFSP